MTFEIAKDQVNEQIFDKHTQEVKNLKELIITTNTVKKEIFDIKKEILVKTLTTFKDKPFDTLKNDNTWTLTIQTALKSLGYYGDGKIDAIYGDKTKKAVEAFQKKSDITVDGLAGPKTIEKLIDALNKESNTTQDTSKNNTLSKDKKQEKSETNTNVTKTTTTEVKKPINQEMYNQIRDSVIEIIGYEKLRTEDFTGNVANYLKDNKITYFNVFGINPKITIQLPPKNGFSKGVVSFSSDEIITNNQIDKTKLLKLISTGLERQIDADQKIEELNKEAKQGKEIVHQLRNKSYSLKDLYGSDKKISDLRYKTYFDTFDGGKLLIAGDSSTYYDISKKQIILSLDDSYFNESYNTGIKVGINEITTEGKLDEIKLKTKLKEIVDGIVTANFSL